ncbi:MAG: hypothetical protein ABJL67_01805 [Sulfitobacter sp.]
MQGLRIYAASLIEFVATKEMNDAPPATDPYFVPYRPILLGLMLHLPSTQYGDLISVNIDDTNVNIPMLDLPKTAI